MIDTDYDDDYDDNYDDDYCYECSGYGNDYFYGKDGELECRCTTCFMNPDRSNEDWSD